VFPNTALFSFCRSFKASKACYGAARGEKIQALFEATYLVGLRKAGVPEE